MHMVSGTLDGRIRYAKDASENKKKNYFNNIESHYARALDELREATLFVMSSSRANRYRIFSKRLFRMAFMIGDEGKDGSERKRENVLSAYDVATITTSEGGQERNLNKTKKIGWASQNSNGSTSSIGDRREDEELAYLMEDIMPRNTLFEILGDVLNLSFNGVPLCRAQHRDEEEEEDGDDGESLRVKSSNKEKRYAARVARGALLCVGTVGITDGSSEHDVFVSFIEMLVDVCTRELENQQTTRSRPGRPRRRQHLEEEDDDTREKKELEHLEDAFLNFYGAIRKNMRDKTKDADWSDEHDDKIRMKNLSNALEEKDDAYASLLLQAEILETLIALVAERPEARAMLAKKIETIEMIVRAYTFSGDDDDDDDDGGEEEKEKDGFEELLNEIGDITEEELKAAFSRAEMQLNDASSALLALLTQVPVRLPDTYTIHDNINAITDISEKNAAAFESLREAAAKARTMCAKLLGGEEYVQEIIENQTLDVVSRYAVEQKARNR